MSNENPVFARRFDLDALRAAAMLLGIVLHASLSFFSSFWMVTDRSQDPVFGIVFSAIHGFRMPLFFVMCGFFIAMLLQRRGRWSLVKHRFQRVFLPLLLGLVTIVPATIWISGVAISSASGKPGGATPTEGASNIWESARVGDLSAIQQHIASGAAVDGVDPEHGGNVNTANSRGEKPLDGAVLDEGTTRYYASLLQLELNEDGLGLRKAAITESLRQHGATVGRKSGVADLLMQMPLFNHLWFLWFIWWLVLGYAAISAIGVWLPSFRLSGGCFNRPPSTSGSSPSR